MTKEERLQKRLANHERVVLSYGNEIVKLIAISIFVIACVIGSLAFYHFKISIITLAVASALLITYILFFRIIRKYVSASIKGEMLITQDIFNTNKVTALKSIKSISSTTIFGINYTTITYKLDGVKYNVRIIKKLECEDIDNEKIIKTAMSIAS